MTDKPHLSIEEMVPRGVYRLRSRNLSEGVWNPETKGFIGIREKFKHRYLFTEYHWDNGPPFGTAKPLELIGQVPAEIELLEITLTACATCHERLEFSPQKKLWEHLRGEADCLEPAPTVSTYKPLFDWLKQYAE